MPVALDRPIHQQLCLDAHRLRRDPAACQRSRPTARREGHGGRRLEAPAESEGKPGHERVAGTERVHDRSGRGRGDVRAARLHPATERARGRDNELRLRVEITLDVRLGLVLAAANERVELDARPPQRRQLARGGDEHARPPRRLESVDIARREERGVHRSKLVPREPIVVTTGVELRTDGRDRPLTVLVAVHERPARRLVTGGGVNHDPTPLERLARLAAGVVVADHREEEHLVGKKRELQRSDRTPTADSLPVVVRMDDVTARRQALDRGELEPLDMADDGDAHRVCLPHLSPERGSETLDRGAETEGVDVVPLLQFGTTAAALAWALLTAALFADRLRHERRRKRGRPADSATRTELVRLAQRAGPGVGEWLRAGALVRLIEGHDPDAEALARSAIRSDDAELRYAAVSALGTIAGDEDWAVDVLLEALAEGRERAARIAAALERAAPRPGDRLAPLLTHPSPVVRFWCARLLAAYPAHRRAVARLSGDPSAQVRAAVLETLRITATGPGDPAALRLAVELLREERPTVRYQAVQTVAELGHGPVAPLLVPLLADESWSVRRQAEESLAALGLDGANAATRALTSKDRDASEGAARVLEATGVIDDLSHRGEDELLERIFTAGAQTVRTAAGRRHGDEP